MPKKILLVEDEAILAMSEAKMLKKHGYQVLTAYSGEKALEEVESDPEISLILMDIDLGEGMDGTETAKKVLKKRELPIVFLTGHSEKEYVDKVKKITNYGYVLKNSGKFVLIESISMAFHLYEANRTIQINAERYRQLFNNINSCAAVYKAVDGGEDFVFIDINKSVEHTENIRKEDVTGKRVTEVFPGIKQFGLLDVFKRVAETGEPEHLPAAKYSDKRITGWRDNYVYKLPSGEIIATYEDVSDHIQMEKTLRDSEKKHKSLYNSLRDALVVVNEKREIIDCNTPFTELFGYTLEEIRGKTTAILFASNEGYERLGRMMRDQNDNPNFIYRTRYRTKTGEVFWGEKKVQYLRDENGAPKGFVGLMRDITEQIRKEDELKKSEEKYRLITENASDIIIQVDGQLKPTYISPSVTETFGYTIEDVCERSLLEFVYPADRKEIEKIIEERTNKQERQFTHTHRAYTKSGKIRWMETNVNRLYDEAEQFIGATYISRDITELRKLEQLNNERRQRLEAVLGATPNAIITFDSQNRINEWNRGAEELFHYTREEVLGHNIVEIVGLSDNTVYEEALSFTRHAVNGKEVPPTETFRYTKEGKALPVIVAGSPIMVDGSFTGVVATYTDISRLKQKEKEVETLLEEKEQLLHEVHHRIKNHMNTISSIISLRAGHVDNAHIREVLEEVQHKIDLMQNIYQTLYTGEDVKSVNISSFLAPLLQDIQSTYIDAHSISISMDIEELEVSSKQSLPVGIIITELITNSVKYAFEESGEGKIHISIYRDRESPDFLCIDVSDNGKGMPVKVAENGEYGFGLTLVESYTQQFNGTMSINSGGGTTVRVVLEIEKDR